MEMSVRPTTLASQCYPPSSSDFIPDHRHVLSAPRPPLRESTGNAQYHLQQQYEEQQRLQQQQQLGALVRSTFAQHRLSIPSPPIIPTQSLSSGYGPPELLRLQQRQHQMQLQRSQRGINPIYLSPQFLSYRKKQANKSKEEKSDQKWPDVLEDAFLDGEDHSSIFFFE